MAPDLQRRAGKPAMNSPVPTGQPGDLPTDDATARTAWRTHQADRAWVEWGICWPPLSIARPRCEVCRSPWPCLPALRAYDLLSATASGSGGGGLVGSPSCAEVRQLGGRVPHRGH